MQEEAINQSNLKATYAFALLSPLTQPHVQAAVVACLHARQLPLLRFSECDGVSQNRQDLPLGANCVDFCEHDSALRRWKNCVRAAISMLLSTTA